MPYSDIVEVASVAGTALLAVGHRCILTSARALNTTAADAYLQLFDEATAAAVTPGTTVPQWVVKSEASDPSLGDGLPTDGLVFENGIVVASTTALLGATGAIQHVRLGIQ